MHHRIRIPTLVLACLLTLTGELGALQHERIHAEPQTSWASRGRAAAAAALARLAATDAAAPRPFPLAGKAPVQGTLQLAGVMVHFAGEPADYDVPVLNDRFFGPGVPDRPSLASYFDEASGGLLQVGGGVTTAVQTPRTSASYVGSRTQWGGTADDLAVFVADVLTAADAVVDWRAFLGPVDLSIPIVRVPALVIFTAGQGGHCPGDSQHIWPHRWHVTGLLGSPFVTSQTTSDGRAIVVDDYVIQPVEACGSGELNEIGVLAHEVGHLLGLPDLYDTTSPNSRGPVGHWDLMATGNYNTPATPAQLGAWSRAALGWVSVSSLAVLESGSSQDLVIPPVQTALEVVHLPFAASGEFVLLENRRRIGSDQALLGEGMLVWYIDPERVSAGFDANQVNANPPGVAVLQADGRRDLELGTNRGDAGDVWPGTAQRTRLDATTEPALVSRATGKPAGYALSDIHLSGDDVRLVVRRSAVAGHLVILPEQLPAWWDRETVHVQLSATLDDEAGGALGSVTWSANPDTLDQLGLTLDPATGTLSGVVTATSEDLVLRIQAEETETGRYGERSYEITVRRLSDIVADDVVAALLNDTMNSLPPEAAEHLDAIGNQNGILDIGDLVVALRSGLLGADSLAAASLRARIPTATPETHDALP